MKNLHFTLGTALAALLLCTSSSMAGAKLHVQGELTGQAMVIPPTIGEGVFDYQLGATGTVTPLGEVDLKVVGALRVDAALNVSSIPPTLFIARTSDEDTIYGLIRWQTVTVGDGTYDLSGTYEVLGGTGAFTNAKGTGTGSGAIDSASFAMVFQIDGSLSVPKVKPPKKPKKTKPSH